MVHADLAGVPPSDALMTAVVERTRVALAEGGPSESVREFTVEVEGGLVQVRLVVPGASDAVGAVATLQFESSFPASRFDEFADEAGFTRREREVATLVIQGLRNLEIAARLGVGENAVKFHLRRIYRKAEVSGRGQLAARFLSEEQGGSGPALSKRLCPYTMAPCRPTKPAGPRTGCQSGHDER